MAGGIDEQIEQRIAAVDRVYLTTPDVRDAVELITRTRERRRQDGTAFCSLITGVSGTGKSRIFSRYLSSQEAAEEGTMPVLHVLTPAPFSQVAFARAFLRAMGKPIIPGQDQNIMLDRINRSLGQMKTDLVLLEEASHVVDHRAKDAKIPYWVTDTIKANFLETAKVPVVMNGIPVARELFVLNSQLLTRRVGVVELTPYDMSDTTSRDRFMVLLELYERASGFPRKVLAGNDALARRVHWATKGIYGHLATLIKDATEVGIRRQADGLTVDVLAESYARLADPEKGWVNPFLVDSLPVLEAPDQTRVTRLHKRTRKVAA